MPFIPHTDEDVKEMLATIGAGSIEELFDEIPESLRCGDLKGVPEGMNEMEVSRMMSERASQDGQPLCFVGAGAYDHHIPAVVWEIASRGEFYSAYTPYQAEASQGTLQLLYEYQTMMTRLTAMEVSNASLYDGASALAEAVLMAVRAHRKSKSRRILMPRSLNPIYRQVVEATVRNQGIELVELPFDPTTGTTGMEALEKWEGEDVVALVIPQPNFFGALEDVDGLTEWAAANNVLSIAVVNPTSLALLNPPGEWGQEGVDIACGEGQPMGAPLSSGGPYFGFICCKQKHVRQMPGRIIGATVDIEGKRGYALTLQAREQHIRRSKATSNICTNQGLLVTAATIYMALLGPEGLRQVALACHVNLNKLKARLTGLAGVEQVFSGASFHETVLQLERPVGEVLEQLADRDILGGYDLSRHFPELGNALLVCATETRTGSDIERYGEALQEVLSNG